MTSGRIPLWHPLVLVPLALSAWVYYPITRVYFFADDLIHLLTLANDGPLAFVLKPFGGHALVARNLAFLAAYELFGLRSEAYYWTVLLTHLLDVVLLFAALHALTRSAPLACFGAALWGASPLAVGTIGWYSVYGQTMAATTFLVVLAQLARRAATDAPLTTRTAVLWYALLLLGVVCFGTGIGVALAFPAALFLLLPSAWRRPGLRAAYLALPLVALAVYYGARRLYLLVGPLPMEEALHEQFARDSVAILAPMLGHLLGFSVAGVVLGFFQPAYPSPACWVAVGAFCAGLGVVAWRADGATRRAALAMAIVALTTYLVIALGRAAEYAVWKIPAWGAAGYTRYHYLTTIPIVVLLCLVLQQVGRLGRLRAVPSGLALIAGLGLIVGGRLHSRFFIDEHPQARHYVAQTLRDLAADVASQPAGSTVFLENRPSPVIVLGPAVGNLAFPGRAALFAITHRSDALDGRRVRFVEPDDTVRAYYIDQPGQRMKQLLVAPADVPQRR